MTRSERELIIQRYLNGEMTSAQEQDFFIQVAVDKELRQELKAFRTVDSALRKDREAERSEHTALRSRVASMLAVNPGSGQTAPVTPGTMAPEPAAPALPAPAAAVTTATGLGRAIVQWGVMAGATAILAVGAFLMLQRPEPPATPAPASSAPASTGTANESSGRTPAAIRDRGTDAAPARTGTAGQPGLPRRDASEARNGGGVTLDRSEPARHTDAARDRAANEGTTRQDARHETRASQSPAPREGAVVPTAEPARTEPRVNDTISIGVRVQIPKR